MCREIFDVYSESPPKAMNTLWTKLASFRRVPVLADLLLISPIRLSVCMLDNSGAAERIFMKLDIGKFSEDLLAYSDFG
jgi:hypothetical protein